jgi:hypothetical protein
MRKLAIVAWASLCLFLFTLTAVAAPKEGKGPQNSRAQEAGMDDQRSKAGQDKVRDGEDSDADSDSDSGQDSDSGSNKKSDSNADRDSDSDSGAGSDAASRGQSNSRGQSDSKGNEQSAEMQERRDERKEIQGDYRSEREPGAEGDKGEDQAGKKPWYKFWE